MRTETLFSSSPVREALADRLRRMESDIDSIPEVEVQSSGLDELAERIASEARVDVPVLKRDELSWTERDEVRRATGNSKPIHAHCPFEGDQWVFRLSPSDRDLATRPEAAVERSTLTLDLTHRADEMPDLVGQANGALGRIDQHLGWIREDADEWNDSLLELARTRLQQRRDRLEKRAERYREMGIDPKRT